MSGGERLGRQLGRLPVARAALEYAERAHYGQRREADGAAFVLHPREVGWLLYRAGAPEHVIAAGLLHDTLEKTAASPAELSGRFGARVERLVLAVTEDGGIPGYRERKAALRAQVTAAGEEAMMVFAADKVSKARELRQRLGGVEGAKPISAPRRRHRFVHYEQSLELLEEHLPGSPLVAQLRTELRELRAYPGLARARELVG